MSLNDFEIATSRGIQLCDLMGIPDSHRPGLQLIQLEKGIAGVCKEFEGVIAIDVSQLSSWDEYDAVYVHELAHFLLPPRLYHSWPFLAVSALLIDNYMLAQGVDDFDYFEKQVFLDMQWWWLAPQKMRLEHINKARSYADRLKNRSVIDGVETIKRGIPAFHFYSLFTCRRPSHILSGLAVVGVVGWYMLVAGGWKNYAWIFNS